MKGDSMKNRAFLIDKIKNSLIYGGIDKKDYDQIRDQIDRSNIKALIYWSVLVSLFWIYCVVMSFYSYDYMRCRPAYIISLCSCVATFLIARFVVTRYPSTLSVMKFLFRLSLLGGGIGIAVCHPDVRSLTLFAVAIISPSVFIDSTVSSLAAHCSALVIYILLGSNTIVPDIFYWGLGNYLLFSIFGLLIGNAINRERFERHVYAEFEKKLADIQMRYAYYDRLTELKNRHAFEDKLLELESAPPAEYCVVMADINGLKETNDTIGHNAGDELIIGAAECLTAAFGGIDTIYRIGGDEFCIILNDSIENVQLCITELEALLSKWHGRYIKSVSVSTGVAESKDHDTVESVIIEADKNMYTHKREYYEKIGVDRRKN